MVDSTRIAIAAVKAQALRDAAAATYTHTTTGQKGERTKTQRPVLTKDVSDWLLARADVIEADARLGAERPGSGNE